MNIEDRIKEHLDLVNTISSDHLSDIETSINWIVEALKNRNKIVFAGNGGSAADAQHLSAEFIGRFQMERHPLPAIALTTDTSILTAIGNDYGFEQIFSRQIMGLMNQADIFYGISTSGNSLNIHEAVLACERIPCKTIGLLGNDGGNIGALVDLPIIINSTNTARIQEMHELIGHIICEQVEHRIFK